MLYNVVYGDILATYLGRSRFKNRVLERLVKFENGSFAWVPADELVFLT